MKRGFVFIRIIGVTKEVYECELDEERVEKYEPFAKDIKLNELRGIGGGYRGHLWLILI